MNERILSQLTDCYPLPTHDVILLYAIPKNMTNAEQLFLDTLKFLSHENHTHRSLPFQTYSILLSVPATRILHFDNFLKNVSESHSFTVSLLATI